MAVREYNRAIKRELGIENLICTIEEPSIESFDLICKNDHIAIMAITGGPAYPLPLEDAIHGVAVFEAMIGAAASGSTYRVA